MSTFQKVYPYIVAPMPPEDSSDDTNAELPGNEPEIVDGPTPTKVRKWMTVGLMVVAFVVSLWMINQIKTEAKYALTSTTPIELSSVNSSALNESLNNRYVRGEIRLVPACFSKYTRPTESDSFCLARPLENADFWVEIRIPKQESGARYVFPSLIAGRLIRVKQAGLQHSNMMERIRSVATEDMSDNPWLLVEGDTPSSSRWALAMLIMFTLFALWNFYAIVRVIRRLS